MQARSTSSMEVEVARIQRQPLDRFDAHSPSTATSVKDTAKMVLFRLALFALFSFLAVQASGLTIGRNPNAVIVPYKKAPLENLVTWDDHSLFVRGERIVFYSGEFHPFRLPVPGLWLDVFQKVKALGYSGVSFYTNWALLEGTPGVFSAEGVFDFEPFFAAASEAGIYLLARPGPYINAEVSGGGYPGWLQRVKGKLRTPAPDYLKATDLYVQSIGEIIAKAQITNGGPVILLQPENEYTQAVPGVDFPNGDYFAYVEQQYRKAGIVVPLISNDAAAEGIFAPGNGTGAVDIYGHDGYPLGFDCANPYTWPDGSLPTNYHTLHLEQAPTGPYAIVEFQGGSFDPWGGPGFGKCTSLLNQEFERVFYKNDFSFGVTIFNIYMTYGGTNWGNLGHPGGYTSYDYGAVIAEDLTVSREKYSEAKLEVNFLMASPAYITATPGNGSNGSYVDTSAIEVTPLFGDGTNFYVARHAAYNSLASTSYRLTIPVGGANVTIPQLTDFGTSLTLNGRDSKIHVTDYDLGGINLQYSSAEIFTWAKYPTGTVLILYGGENEVHEFALPPSIGSPNVYGSNAAVHQKDSATIIQWKVTPDRRIVSFPGLTVYLLWRNDAYNYWVLDLPAASPIGNFTSSSKTKVIAKAGYLLRTATVSGNNLYLTGDLNATTTLEIIGGLPSKDCSVYFNNQPVSITESSRSAWGSRPLVRIKASTSATRIMKDASLFPVAIPNPSGHPELGHAPPAPISRHMSDLKRRPDPAFSRDVDVDRESIWISYCQTPMIRDQEYHIASADSLLITDWPPVAPWERLKIGGGTPPILTRHGWLIVYHGVSEIADASKVGSMCYSAGVMVLTKSIRSMIRYRSGSGCYADAAARTPRDHRQRRVPHRHRPARRSRLAGPLRCLLRNG